MQTDNPTVADQSGQSRRDQADARLAAERLRPLPAWLTSRGQRRAVALLPTLPLVCGLVAGVLPDGGTQTTLIALTATVSVLTILLLRRTTRLLDAVPDRFLDEREIDERNDAYRRAYQLVGMLLFLLAALAVADGTLTRTSGPELVPGDGWVRILVTSALVATMVPAAVAAWRWVDETDD